MTVSERRQLWVDQIAAQKASGLTITNWCENIGSIAANSIGGFKTWKSYLSKGTATLIQLGEGQR